MKTPLPQIHALLNPHSHPAFGDEAGYEIERIAAEKLLMPGRFDLAAKLLLARNLRLGRDVTWAKAVYREHLRKWNGKKIIEPDGSGKTGFEAFYDTFAGLCREMSQNGFNEDISILPVGANGVLLDGAHRAGAAIDLGLTVPTARCAVDTEWYDFRYFRNLEVREDCLDAMALEFLERCDNGFIAYLFPVEGRDDDKALAHIAEVGEVFYERDLELSRAGVRNLVMQLYRGEPWVGTAADGFAGAELHVKNRYVEGQSIRCVFFTASRLEDIVEMKARVRAIYERGNFPIHINDSYEEALRLGRQILNTNGRHFMRYARPERYPATVKRFEAFRDRFVADGLEPHDYMIDSSFVMALYGLRNANDVDYLHRGPAIQGLGDLYQSHNGELPHYPHDLSAMLDDPRHYFFFDGIKVASLALVSAMKERRGEEKDRVDLELIERLYQPPDFRQRVAIAKNALVRFAARRYQRFLRRVSKIIPRRYRPAVCDACAAVFHRKKK